MARKKSPEPQEVSNSVLVTLHFSKPRKPLGYGMGFVVRFAVAPKVGDVLRVDQYSIRQIPQEELHRPIWKVVDVFHDLTLKTDANDDDGTGPALATLWVTVHPVESKNPRK